MWNSFVSTCDTALGKLVSGFVTTELRYPALMIVFLFGLTLLAVLIWVELVKAWRNESRPDPHDARPIKLRR